MSSRDLARNTVAEVAFAGVDITNSIRPYLLDITYTDNEEDETDDLQIKLQDRDGLWMQQWLQEAEAATAAAKLIMGVVFVRKNWNSDGSDRVLDCGEFELDSVKASGPPSTVTIKGTALPYSAQIRQTKKSKAWEAYTLSGIANEMASNAGMTCMYEADEDPYYDRAEQMKVSDITFLSQLCHMAGISLKVTNHMIVLFDQAKYEKQEPVFTFKYGDGTYISYTLNSSTAEAQYASCRVSYTDPGTGMCIEGIAKTEDYNEDASTNQQLEISAKVGSIAEAEALAEKQLRLHNKFAKTASFTIPGNPNMVAGVTVDLKEWGGWDGRYIVKQAVHSLGSSGYQTKITLRRALEGY